MLKKNILLNSTIIIIFLISLATISYFAYIKTKNNTENNLAKIENFNKTLNIIPIDTNVSEDQIILSKKSQGLYKTDNMTNNTFIAEDAEIIVIGTIKSLDGVVNYNPTKEDYVMTRTVGTIEVDKVIKVSLALTSASTGGGIIPISEYEKGIPEEQAEKFGFNQMSEEEKETKYISEQLEEDIEIEQGKTYLMYLKYYSDYGKYSICYLQYGIREVKLDDTISKNSISTLNTNEYKNIMVKNNKNGTYETLDSILPKSLKNGNVSM